MSKRECDGQYHKVDKYRMDIINRLGRDDGVVP